MYLRYFRTFLTLFCLVALSACGAARSGNSLLNMEFWESGPFAGSDLAELGIAEMSKGNYLEAEAHFRNALDSNPRDIEALLGAAILYQNTGQLVRSRELYEAILALRPDDSHQFINLSDISTRPISQVANVNLALLRSGGVISGVNAGAAGVANQATVPTTNGFASTYGDGNASGVDSMVMPTPTFPTAVMPSTTMAMQPDAVTSMSMQSPFDVMSFSGADKNTVSRFTTIRALRDQGLLTPDEFRARRQANIGALLPLTSGPPSAGLDRPVPSTDQITNRLKAIGQALALRAISVSQHASERTLILDALMPSAPLVLANPAPPPQGLMEAADMVRRIEMLRDAGFISSDEYARERAAIEAAMLPPAPEISAVSSTSQPSSLMAGETMMMASGPQPGLHLASYRSVKQAEAGWSQLKRAHGEILGGLKHTVTPIDLGSKGKYYRLIAGPYANNSGAEGACKKLKSRRQFCDPAIADFG